MIKLLLTISIISLITISCSISKTKLSSDGQEVKILSKAEKSKCSTIDKVIGLNEKGSDDLAQNHARNLAASLDGNAIFFDEMVSSGNMVKAFATVYDCK